MSNLAYLLLTPGLVMTGDLFQETWTTGNLHTIAPVVAVLGGIAVVILSLSGFSTIISAISKPAIALMYFSNRKLWDRVDEAKRMDYESYRTAGGRPDLQASGAIGASGLHKLTGAVIFNILRVLPNIKSVSENDSDGGGEDKIQDPKSYAMKLLASTALFCFLGVFIFYGYHAKLGNKIGEGSRVIMDSALNKMDVEEIGKALDSKLANINFSTKGSKVIKDKAVFRLAEATTSVVRAAFPDMKRESSQAVASNLENFFIGKQSQWSGVDGIDGWDISVSKSISPLIERNSVVWEKIDDTSWAQNNNSANSKVFYYQIPVSSLETGSPKQEARNEEYIQAQVTFTKRASSKRGSLSDGILTVSLADQKKDGKGFKATMDIGSEKGLPLEFTGKKLTGEDDIEITIGQAGAGSKYTVYLNKKIDKTNGREFKLSGPIRITSSDRVSLSISKIVIGTSPGSLTFRQPNGDENQDYDLDSFREGKLQLIISGGAAEKSDDDDYTPENNTGDNSGPLGPKRAKEPSKPVAPIGGP